MICSCSPPLSTSVPQARSSAVVPAGVSDEFARHSGIPKPLRIRFHFRLPSAGTSPVKSEFRHPPHHCSDWSRFCMRTIQIAGRDFRASRELPSCRRRLTAKVSYLEPLVALRRRLRFDVGMNGMLIDFPSHSLRGKGKIR